MLQLTFLSLVFIAALLASWIGFALEIGTGRMSTPHHPFVTSILEVRSIQNDVKKLRTLDPSCRSFLSLQYPVKMASPSSNTNTPDELTTNAASHSDPPLEIDVRS